MKGENFYKGS